MGSEYETGSRGRLPGGLAPYTCARCGMVSYNFNDAAMRYCGACHAFEDPLGMAKKPKPERVGPAVRRMLFDELADMQDEQKIKDLEKIQRTRGYVIVEEEEP